MLQDVGGENRVPTWISEGFVSIGWSEMGDLEVSMTLDELRDAERHALASAHLAPAGADAPHGAMRWTWPPPRELADPLLPITHAAVELLTTGPLGHLWAGIADWAELLARRLISFARTRR